MPDCNYSVKSIDFYIGVRYNYIVRRYIVIRYNVILNKGEKVMSSVALTEAVFYILLSLTEPLHGYGIMQNAEKLSNGRVRLAAGTLYGALSSLLEKGWICALPGSDDSRKKEYVITDTGREVVKGELKRLKELYDNGTAILEGMK